MLITMVVVTAITGPKVLPIKVINEPVDGIARENSARVLPSKAMAIAAAIIVSGEPIPADAAISAELKKKLIAGAIFAMVEVAMSSRLSAPRSRRGTTTTGTADDDCSLVLIGDDFLSLHTLIGMETNEDESISMQSIEEKVMEN